MKLSKSKLGFLLAAVYIFTAVLVSAYTEFGCNREELYCVMLEIMPSSGVIGQWEWQRGFE